jgi:dimeric dUTPase (all-alpha-NTP-PPase superfamily)
MDFKELWNKHLDYWRTDLIPKSREFFMGKEVFGGYRIFMISSALVHECIELQRETNFKWYKKGKELDIVHIKEELIDIEHFVIQMAIELGMTPEEFIEEYNKKLDVNIKRARTGY